LYAGDLGIDRLRKNFNELLPFTLFYIPLIVVKVAIAAKYTYNNVLTVICVFYVDIIHGCINGNIILKVICSAYLIYLNSNRGCQGSVAEY
jgi:hypothetical protein